ncbi:MAG TPA: hypothetical protein VLD64_03490 [Nitrosarchaeum sp.]|jgi:hypothetical protein|nr:hypothetical protein [Nitrosarchaeum sp.]
MQVSQIENQTTKVQKTNSISSENSSKITWRDIQGLSWIFQDDI